MSQAITQGLHHLGLTVPDVEEVARFFIRHLQFSEVARRPDYPAIFITDNTSMLTLWQATDPSRSRQFDRRHNIGLHHFALRVPDKTALVLLHEQLAGVDGVAIEFGPEPLAGTNVYHMMCRIPGGLRIEFIAVPG